MSQTKPLGPELSDKEKKEIDERCDTLAVKYSCSKVHAVVFIDAESKKRTYCFLKEPNFVTKIAVMDKAAAIGIYNAAEELRQATVIKEESDPITYGETPECDDFKMGVVNFCVKVVRTKENVYKKK